jgi:hypothetical protein
MYRVTRTISLAVVSTLITLDSSDARRVKYLAAPDGVVRPSVTVLAKRLERGGLIERGFESKERRECRCSETVRATTGSGLQLRASSHDITPSTGQLQTELRIQGGDMKLEAAMTGRRRTQLAEERADLILASKLGVNLYAVHFEAQVCRGKIRRLLYASYVHWARACTNLTGHDLLGIW